MKSEERKRLQELTKENKIVQDANSEHWTKVAAIEKERKQLLGQIIKEEKLLNDAAFNFRIDSYVQQRSCILNGPDEKDFKRLDTLLRSTPEGHWDHVSLDLGSDAHLSINDGEVYINITHLRDVPKVIEEWSLKVTFKNLEEHKAKVEEDLKIIKGFLKKVKNEKQKKAKKESD